MASGAIVTSGTPNDPGERPASRPAAAPGGFLTVYKRGQGYYTRLGTAVGAGLLIAATLLFFYREFKAWELFQGREYNAAGEVVRTYIRTGWVIGAVSVVGLVLAGLAWWLMNKPDNAEFLIATDSEMKKVNWTSRSVLVGSTKVVIFFMFAVAIFLFVTDVVFGYFFHWIHVLETSPFGG
jgi:preprotein translocase subunit SecE